jgi:hypothetical protein
MTPEELIYSLLKSFCDGRVTPIQAVQAGAFPYITYQRISTAPITELKGDTGAGFVRMQIDIVGSTYEQIRPLARLVRAACKDDMNIQNQLDQSEPERDIYRIIQDYTIFEEGF